MIKHRVVQMVEELGFVKEIFFESIGMTSANFRGKAAETPLNSTAIENIFTIVPYLNLDWLITGQGSMLRPDDEPNTPPVSAPIAGTLGTDQDHTAIALPLPQDKKAAHEIYLYDVAGAAGYGSFDEVISKEKIVGKYIVPEFRNVDWMIYVKGSSMYPKYSSGDIIACRVINESRFIQWGKVYAIATREQGILVKRLGESEQESCVLAISDNPSYKPFDIPKDEILGIALVIGVIRLE